VNCFTDGYAGLSAETFEGIEFVRALGVVNADFVEYTALVNNLAVTQGAAIRQPRKKRAHDCFLIRNQASTVIAEYHESRNRESNPPKEPVRSNSRYGI
jgi:hypothetical protein